MKYIVENWFVIVGLIAVCAAGGYAVYVFVKMPSDKQLNKVREHRRICVKQVFEQIGGKIMLYYLGKGTEFKKEDCKEYKTIEGAMKAAAKDESFVVWDENGNVIGSLTDNVPEGALQTNPDGSVNTYDADGNKVGTVDAETVEKMTTFESDEDAAGQQEDAEDGGTASNDAETTNPPSEPETGENGANTEPQEAEDEPEDKVIIPQGKMRVTVICDGSLNIRRSAEWGNDNICGRAIRGQSYYVKEIHVVDGKKMVRTIGDLYLSGESEHVQFEQL